MKLFRADAPVTAYVNGRVHTFDQDTPLAAAFAEKLGRFLAVGSNGYVRQRAGAGAKVVDLGGATVVPGFADAHVHLVDYGLMLSSTADLVGCSSVAEMRQRLRDHMAKNGNSSGWVLGHGFDQELFDPPVFPTREDLDAVANDRPVIVSRICGHAAVGNTFAMQRCKADLPEGARETGLVTEDDTGALFAGAPEPSDAEIDAAILEAGGMAASLGITSVHCLLSDLRQLDRLYALHDDKRLPIRFYAQIPYSRFPEAVERGLRTGWGDEWLRIGALKIFVDGSMGARTAAMIEDFSDDPGNRGMLLIDQAALTDQIKKAQAAGFQTATHAIGDRAVEVTVNAIDSALAHQSNTLRHRVEHASQMTRRALVKMANRTIPVSVQPQFVQTDFWTIQRVGPERYRWSYPFKTMIGAGVPCAMSSDCYVERLDPYELIYRAWERDEHSKQESLTPEETIRAYTGGGAFASHQEHDLGSISEGKLADVVVLPRPIFDIPPAEILDLRPEFVLTGGQRR